MLIFYFNITFSLSVLQFYYSKKKEKNKKKFYILFYCTKKKKKIRKSFTFFSVVHVLF